MAGVTKETWAKSKALEIAGYNGLSREMHNFIYDALLQGYEQGCKDTTGILALQGDQQRESTNT